MPASLLSVPVREASGAVLGFLRVVREASKSTKGTDSSTERHTPEGARWITVHPSGHDEGHGQPVLISGSGQVLGGMGGKFNGQHIGDVAGWKQAGTPKPEGYGAGTHEGYNQHLATYGGAKVIADVTVHGQPVKHAGGTFSVRVAGGKGIEKTLNQHGQGQTAGGAFLEKHPDGGVIYHGGMGAPDTWHDFARHMSEDLLTHSAEHEHRRMMGRADTGPYKDEHEAEGHAYRKAAMKQVRDYIRAEGGIKAGRTRTVGQELQGTTARTGDEYRHQLPSWAKNANGKHTTDQMARLVGDTFPHLGVETEDDLRKYLMGHERQRKADAAAEAKARAAKTATAQPRAETEAPTTDEHGSRTTALIPRSPAAVAAHHRPGESFVVRDKLPTDATRSQEVGRGHYLVDHPQDVADVRAGDATFNPQSHHVVRWVGLGGKTEAPRIVPKNELAQRTEEVRPEDIPAFLKTNEDKASEPPAAEIDAALSKIGASKLSPEQLAKRDEEQKRVAALPVVHHTAPARERERPTWDTAPRGEEGDYQNGHLRFNRESWQTFAVDHPASIAEYNRLHGEGKRDTPYDPSQHHVIHPLTGSAGDHPVAAPVLAPKSAVSTESKYIKRGSYSPEQQAAVEHLNKQKVKPPAADAVPLFADLAVKDRPKPSEKETKRREGGLFAGIRESQRLAVRECAGGAVL